MTHPSPTALEEMNAIAATDRDAAHVKTDGAVPSVVLAAVRACAASWMPDARLLGNVRAGDIVRAIAALEAELDKERKAANQWMGEAVRDHNDLMRAQGRIEDLLEEAQLSTRLPTEAQISYLLEVLAREGVANDGGDFMRRKISKAILALLSGAATPAPTAALTEEELLTPELIKKAADAGERVGWDDVLTPNAQIYHRAIDLKKYETALRAVLPIIIDRLAKSPPQGAEE